MGGAGEERVGECEDVAFLRGDGIAVSGSSQWFEGA